MSEEIEKVDCKKCKGTGKIRRESCKRCGGTGRFTKPEKYDERGAPAQGGGA